MASRPGCSTAGSAQVSLLTDVQVVAGGVGLGAVAVSQGPHPARRVVVHGHRASGRPLVVEDAPHDHRVEGLPPVLAGAVGSYLGVPLSDGNGLVVGAFCVYDRSARGWSESEILVLTELAAATTAELERAAAESERDLARLQFALAMESGGIGSWEWDLTARRMTANRQLLAMFGLPADLEHTPVPVSTFIAAVHPATATGSGSAVDAALDQSGEYAQEYRVLQPDGSVRWIAARGRPLYDDTRRAVRLVGAAYDTTDRHLAAESAQSESTLMALIARASDLLAGSLEAEDAVRSFARLVVPGARRLVRGEHRRRRRAPARRGLVAPRPGQARAGAHLRCPPARGPPRGPRLARRAPQRGALRQERRCLRVRPRHAEVPGGHRRPARPRAAVRRGLPAAPSRAG